MSGQSTLSLATEDVENVVVFVGDAVRWDHSYEKLADRGRTYKTVSASLHTPTSFATMLTGRHPIVHGVHGFNRPVPDGVASLFDPSAVDTAFGDGYMNDWLADRQRLFGPVARRSLDEMEPPFVWVNRDGGGHAPYGGFDASGQGYRGDSARVYLDRHAGDTARLRADYARGIDDFVGRVDGVLETLEARGLRESTLVIVASDHGELLGEYGQIGHNFPASPELVHVPTCFIGPGCDGGLVREGVLRHVDIAPTIVDALDLPPGPMDGHSAMRRLSTTGISHYNRSFADVVELGLQDVRWGRHVPTRAIPDLRLDLVGCWDRDGGYAVNRGPRHAAAAVYLLRLFMTPEGKHVRETGSYAMAAGHVNPSFAAYGTPAMDEAAARDAISRYLDAETMAETAESLDPAARQQLEDLGYV